MEDEGARLLGAADWGVIILYLAGVIALGVWLGRGQRTTRDYFLGGRDISWWGVGLSIIATETSALTFIGLPGIAYGGNLGFIQVVIGYVIARIILAIFLVPHYFKGDIYSPYQLFGNAFGTPARRTAGLFFLISGVLAAGVRVYVTSIPIQEMLDVSVVWAIALFIILSLIYTYVGGIKAVVWTDAAQFFLFVGGGLFVLFYIPTLMEGGMGAAFGKAAEAGKLAWLNVAPPEGEGWLRFALTMPYNFWMGIIGATIFVMSTHGADQLIVQRVLACKSVREGRKALALSAVIILPLMLLFLLVGALLWVFYQSHSITLPLNESGQERLDFVFPIFILNEMPPVIRGLLIVGILSAAMSSVSSALSALASVSVMDFLKGMLGDSKSETFYFKASRYSTVVWGVLLALVAYWSQHAVSILNLALSLNGLTNGAMLAGLVMALWWRGSPWPLVIGMGVSLGTMIAIHFFGEAWLPLKLGWPWYTLVGASVTLVVAFGLRMILPSRSNAATRDTEKEG